MTSWRSKTVSSKGLKTMIADYSGHIPDDAVLMNVLHVVEYLNPEDGEIYKADLSHAADGDDLMIGKAFELIEWARMLTITPMIGELIHDFVYGDDDGEEEVGA